MDIANGRWRSSSVLDQIFGVPADYEKTVDGWANLAHPDERQEVLDHLLKEVVGEKKPCDRQYRIVRDGDKQVRWVHGLGRLQFNEDGQPVSMFGTVQDITERKQAEEALGARQEAKYRRLHQSMRDAFVSVDMDGFIREFNEAYVTMLGYDPDELLKLRYTDLTPEKWHGFQAKIIQEQVLLRGYSEIYEKEYRRKDGTVFPVELRTVLIKDDRDQPAVMWAIIQDISERKQAAQALQKAHDELEQRVTERTLALRQSHDELQAIYAERKHAHEALQRHQRTLKHLLHASDHERQLIAYEIHDGLAQQLAGAIMQCSDAFDHLRETSPKQAADAFHAGRTMLRQGHFEARRLIAGVRPPILDEEGIVAAVGHLVNEQIQPQGTEDRVSQQCRV